MSTKIWHAFRAPVVNLNDAIDFLHDHMHAHVFYDARGRAWEAVNLGPYSSKASWNARRMQHVIFEASTEYWMELQMMCREDAVEKKAEGQQTAEVKS